MKQISQELKAHLVEEVTTLATCWKVTRRDGQVLGFTDHDADILFEGQSYLAASGFNPSAVESSSALNVDNMEIEAVLATDVIEDADILAGLYDYAAVDIFMLNYHAPDMGRMTLRSGWIGEVTLRGQQFVAELRGLAQQLATRIGEHYTPACRADLGDARCKIALQAYTHDGTVQQAEDGYGFADATSEQEAGYFAFGRVTFLSGDNAGLSMEVKEYANGRFTFVLPLPYPIQAGDAYRAVAGCDKRFSTCCKRFNNAINFRAEPHVPGTDRIAETAATRNR